MSLSNFRERHKDAVEVTESESSTTSTATAVRLPSATPEGRELTFCLHKSLWDVHKVCFRLEQHNRLVSKRETKQWLKHKQR